MWLIIPLLLSTFAHIWNPIGFPSGPVNDEGIYLGRAMQVLRGIGLEESGVYVHPYFSQLFLASIFWIIGYPTSLHPIAGNIHSIETLYMVPRVLMGALAVVDTFLIYKIALSLYKRREVAFIASILFAVMPITFPTRWILLEPIQLPFILSSIFFAAYTKRPPVMQNIHKNTNVPRILISGIFLGLAIFTKIPAFTMIPLVGYLIFTSSNAVNNNNNKKDKIQNQNQNKDDNNDKNSSSNIVITRITRIVVNNVINLKALGLWFIPVILMPAIWPAYAISVGQFDGWLNGLFSQTQRANNTFFSSIYYNFNIDSIFVVLGIAGLVFAIIKKDILIVLWILPFLIFLYIIGFVSFWHFIPILSALCIAAARLVVYVSDKIILINKITQALSLNIIIVIGVLLIGIIGLINTAPMMLTGDNSAYFKSIAFLSQYLQNVNDNNNANKITVISNPFYLWIPKYVFNLPHIYTGYYDYKPVKTKKILSIFDEGFIERLKKHEAGKQVQKIQRNSNLYKATKIATFGNSPHKNSQVSVYLYESKATTITANISKFLTYNNPVYGITILYPYNWEINPAEEDIVSPDNNTVSVVRFDSQYENYSDKFQENLGISIENVSDRNITRYVDNLITDIRESYPSFNIIESNPSSSTTTTSTTTNLNSSHTKSNNSTYKIVYSIVLHKQEMKIPHTINLKGMEIWTMIGTKVYEISYTAEAKKYSHYLPTVQKMIDSFHIVK